MRRVGDKVMVVTVKSGYRGVEHKAMFIVACECIPENPVYWVSENNKPDDAIRVTEEVLRDW